MSLNNHEAIMHSVKIILGLVKPKMKCLLQEVKIISGSSNMVELLGSLLLTNEIDQLFKLFQENGNISN